jgi:hypothetical protein
MSKYYSIGDLYSGMKIQVRGSDDVWEIETIDFDHDNVSFISVESRYLKRGQHAFSKYSEIMSHLNTGYYIEIPEETFQIET